MRRGIKFLLILSLLFFVSISIVSANEDNSTDAVQVSDNCTEDLTLENDVATDNLTAINDNGKTTPVITVKSTKVKTKDNIEIYFKDSQGVALKNVKFNAAINNKNYLLETNSNGVANLGINLPAKSYSLTVSFSGDDRYNAVSRKLVVQVSKLNTQIMPLSNFVVKQGFLNFYLCDQYLNGIANKKITLKIKGKTYTRVTDKNGMIKFRIKFSDSKYLVVSRFSGDNYYKYSSNKLSFYVTSPLSIKIENTKLLSKGYVRVYLKNSKGAVAGSVTLQIGNKKIVKKSNSDGVVVFRSDVPSRNYKVSAKLGKYYVSKKISCYDGEVRDPLRESIPLKNGKPDIDVMPGNYVTGDENGKYTLTKAQYLEVLKRDSLCLFLNKKLTRYTFFKTKNHPNTYHIIKREKWNVIEREINKKLVSVNKKGYGPSSITVSLKGKSYTYPEVRDVQNTAYTCGPVSCSMCSQVLKNYVCEGYLASLAGSKSAEGTKCEGMVSALERNNFECSYFYKASFNNALNELKSGGCALIFHANKHYVSILDISSDGKKVLVSNSYGTYDNIATGWLSVNYLRNKFSHWEESLIVRLNYQLSDSAKNSINSYYYSMGPNWAIHNTHQGIGRV